MGQSKYDLAFKRESVQMMAGGMSAAKVSEKLGIHVKTLYRWRDEYRRDGDDTFPGKGILTPADAELRELRRRVRDLEEENAIPQKSDDHLCKTAEMKYRFMYEHRRQYRIIKMAEIMKRREAGTMPGWSRAVSAVGSNAIWKTLR